VAKNTFCPFAGAGCRDKEAKVDCRFWKPRIGCEIQQTLAVVRTIPNLLRRLENQLEEGKPHA